MSESLDEEMTNHAEHKDEGNASYKSGNYRSAIYQYTLAIESAAPLLDDERQQQQQQQEEETDTKMDSSSDSSSISTPPVTKQILASYHSNRAAASTMILRYDDALFDCDRAIELDPTFLKARIRKAKVLTSLGRWKEASAAYGRAMVYDPNDAALVKAAEEVKKLQRRFDLLAVLLDGTGGPGKAKTQTYPYLSMPPLKESKQALNQINLILASSPESMELLLYKVRVLVYLHNIQEAYALSTSLMRRSADSARPTSANPLNPNATAATAATSASKGERDSILLLLRAHCLYCMGNLDDAVKHARQILSGDPDSKPAFAMHKLFKTLGKKKAEADAAYKTGRFAEGVALYTEALSLSPGSPPTSSLPDKRDGVYRAKLFFNRASASANLRDHAAVAADCTRALRLDPNYVKAYTRRAASTLLLADEDAADEDTEGATRRCREAIRDYETAMELTGKGGAMQNEVTHGDIKKKVRAAQTQMKRVGEKDLYKILAVGRDADDGEIKKCYRKKALKWHPDRHANSSKEEKEKAEKIFRDVNLAYEVLSDREKKRKYDSGVDVEDVDNPNAGHGGHQGHFGGGPGGIDPQVLFQMFMQQQGGF